MKLVKSLLLGSAAGLFAVAGAQAADLPVKKAAPVDYVRVCSTYGAGYFFIPGTDTCLSIRGLVRWDGVYLEQERDDFDNFGMRARARLNIDARQPTEYGLLRAFIRINVDRTTGVLTGLPGGEVVTTTAPSATTGQITTVQNASSLADGAAIELAYVQWGGLTAGRAQSFFDFYTFSDLYSTSATLSDTKLPLIAYTHTFGGGWSATISAEDNAERRNFSNPLNAGAGFRSAAGGFIGDFPGNIVTDPVTGVPTEVRNPAFFNAGTVNAVGIGGYEFPDFVANLRVDQAWGAAQISAAAHQINTTNVFNNGTVEADDEWGFAIQGGVMFKLPFLAAGDELWLQATYAEGATRYASSYPAANELRFTNIRVPISDAFVRDNGDVELSETFAVSGKLLHYWLPNLRSNIHLGYKEIEYGGLATTERAQVAAANQLGLTATAGFPDYRIFEGGGNLIWTPVKQLDLGVEAIYRRVETNGRVVPLDVGAFNGGGVFTNSRNTSNPNGRTISKDDVIEARVRVERTF